MTAKGYKGIMIKEEVASRFRAKAKEEGKTLTAFLNALLESYDKGAGISDLSNKTILRLEGDIKEMMRGLLEDMRR